MGGSTQDASPSTKLASLLLYATCSMVISMVYKGVLSSFDFQAPFTLLALQTLVALLFTTFAQTYLNGYPAFSVPKFDMVTYKQSILPGALFVINIAVGFLGLRLVNVPMFLAVRRTTTMFTMAGEFFILGAVPSGAAIVSVCLIGVGAVIAGAQTFSAEFIGFAFTLMNNALTAVQLNVARRFSDECDVKRFGMVYYNSLTALPLSLLLMVATGEVSYLAQYEGYSSNMLLATTVASCLGVLMTFAVFWCTTTNSPVVTSVTGNIKDVVSTFVGALLFPGFVATVYTVTGLLTSFAGSALFTVVKLRGQAGKAGPKPALPQVRGDKD